MIGNGESRRNFALNQIKDYTIGCNAVHRDFACAEFVAVDRRMVLEILRNEACQNAAIYTRSEWFAEFSSERVKSLPPLPYKGKDKVDQGFHWNSGPYGILRACMLQAKVIHLLGFDLWATNDLHNNIYKDTINYSKSSQRPVSPDFWIYQLAKLFELYPNTNFVQHQHTDWRIPSSWNSFNNLTFNYFSV